MSAQHIREQLNQFNALFKEMDSLYGEFAKKAGMSDAAFWILYTVREEGCCTQTDIYERWAMGKQTVNNEVKRLEADGMIALSVSAEDKRSKTITLTPKGQEYAADHIDIIFEIEHRVFARMPEKTRAALLESSKKYIELFRAETEAFIK